MPQRDFVPWRYTSKRGSHFVRRADTRYTSQQGPLPVGSVGGQSAIGLAPYQEMPRNLTPRVAIVTEPGTGYTARVVIYDAATAQAIAESATTVTFTVHDAGGTAHTCNVTDVVDEKAERVIKR
jgi:hypothetical protein